MNTEELARILATGDDRVGPYAAARRYALALGAGALVAVALMLALLGLRADLAQAVELPMFWVKLAFAGALAAAALFAALRLSRPGARLSRIPAALAAPVIAMWALAAATLARAEPSLWPQLFLGETWASCPFLIAMLSAPLFAGSIGAMRSLAPTRLRLAGAAAGLLAGAMATLVYSLHCPEMQAPFLAFWYLLGMLIPAAVGALAGPRLLRW